MDLTFYYWHRLNHLRPLLWRFHNVHHVDPDMDVTTSFRFHLGEVLYSTLFRLLQVGLMGVSPLTYLLYEFIFNCATMFHHSNVRLPLAWERLLNRVFVTPRMHGVHHSALGPETNSNYSVIFSCGTGSTAACAQRRRKRRSSSASPATCGRGITASSHAGPAVGPAAPLLALAQRQGVAPVESPGAPDQPGVMAA